MLRCKPGDLAVIVTGETPQESEDLGKFVLVIEAGDSYSDEGDSRFYWRCESQSGPLWAYDEFFGVKRWWRVTEAHISDGALRPIRPGEGTDETLTWKEVPKEYAHG